MVIANCALRIALHTDESWWVAPLSHVSSVNKGKFLYDVKTQYYFGHLLIFLLRK